jgi:hypothetical protein
LNNHNIILVQMVLVIIWLVGYKFHANMSFRNITHATMKNKTCNHLKLKTYLSDFKKPYHENYTQENSYLKIPKPYINKFDTMN